MKNVAVKCGEIDGVSIFHWPDYQRGIITLSGKDKSALIKCFNRIYLNLQFLQPKEMEPMLNILATFETGCWTVSIFPRNLHRPAQYFMADEDQILLSPAAVDMGGVLITPREEDFIKITALDCADIFKQVCFDPIAVLKLINQL